VWKEVDTSGDRWEAEDSVLFSIYTPVMTVSLASKQVRLSLCSPFSAIFPLIWKNTHARIRKTT